MPSKHQADIDRAVAYLFEPHALPLLGKTVRVKADMERVGVVYSTSRRDGKEVLHIRKTEHGGVEWEDSFWAYESDITEVL